MQSLAAEPVAFLMPHLLSDIGLSIFFAAAIGAVFYRLRLPLMLAYIVAGIVIGPNLGLRLLTDREGIANVAEIGLVLLMFILGLEIDVRRLLQLGAAVLVNGVTQVVGCAVLGAGVFLLIGYRDTFGPFTLVYLAAASSLSSTLIVVKVLSDRMELDTLTSRITLGVLVLQDLWAIAFLAIQPRLTDLHPAAIGWSFFDALVLLGAGLGIAKFVLPAVFRLIARQPELMLITAVAWCGFMAGLATVLHVSVEMGALFAGVCIASFPYQGDVAAKIAPLRDFFVTLFFVGLGLQIPAPTQAVLGLALVVIGFVSVSRLITVIPVLHALRYGNRVGTVTAVNLSQVSEFALVLAALGVSYKHIGQDVLSAFILAMTVTALISSFAIPHSHRLYQALDPLLTRLGLRDRIAGRKVEGPEELIASPKIVLLGFYREASSLLAEMERRDAGRSMSDVLVVDFNPESLASLRARGIPCAYGDLSDPASLGHLELGEVEIVISTVPDHILKGTSNLDLLRVLKQLAPRAAVIVTAETMESAQDMYRTGADYVMLPRIVCAHFLSDVLEKLGTGDLPVIREAAAAFVARRDEVLA